MKLVYPDWSAQIDFTHTNIHVLNIENPIYFRKIVQELIHQKEMAEGRFVLSQKDSIYDFSKNAEIILSPLHLDFDNKKIQNVIIKELITIANEEEYLETQELLGSIQRYFYKVTDYLNFDVSFEEELSISQILKIAGIKPVKDENSLLSRFVDYIYLLRKALNIRLFIGVQIRSFFSKEELESLYRTLRVNNICFLLLENCNNIEKIENEKWLTIDEDLCEI